MSKSKQAAKWAKDNKTTLEEAGKRFGISRQAVQQGWQSLGYPRYTDVIQARAKQILEDYSKGHYSGVIANKHGISRQAVCHIINKVGLKSHPLPKQADVMRAEFDRAATLVKNGYSYRKAAKEIKVCGITLRKYCASIGIKSQHKSRNPNWR